MILKKVAFFLFTLSGFYSSACEILDKENCSVLKSFVVADSYNELHFNHLCSELDHYNESSRQSYAFFSKINSRSEYKALVLAEVAVGNISWTGLNNAKGIWLNLVKMEIDSLKKWAGDVFSLALRLKNIQTNKTLTGEFSKIFFYSYSGGGYPVNNRYRLSLEGSIDWENFTEPEEEETAMLVNQDQTQNQKSCVLCESPSGDDSQVATTTNSTQQRRGEYKGSQGIYIESRLIEDKESPYILYIVLKNENSGEELSLQGPMLKNIRSYIEFPYSGPRVLTWEVFIPGQQGGLWDWIFDGFRYGDCIYLRKKAKKEFAIHFANQ